MNIAYSADNLAPEMLWKGKFIDAGHHWTDRGIGYEPPAGEGLVTLSKQKAFAFVSEEGGAWPASSKAPTRFRGYQLSPQGNPTFLVEVAGAKVFDAYESVSSPSSALQRSIRMEGNASEPASLLLFSGAVQDPQPNRFSSGGITVQITGGTFRYGTNTVVLDLKNEAAKILYSW